MLNPVIRIENAAYTYNPGGPSPGKAINGANLTINAGETIALIGTTGSGKSTLLQLVAGLLFPSSGEIEVCGVSLHSRKLKETELNRHRQRAVMAMQRPEDMLFKPFLGDDVAFGPSCYGLKGYELALRVRDAMESVGLPYSSFKDRQTMSLSGGERRKAGLAGVLALDPEILLLDEPTAGLDPEAAQTLLDLFKELGSRGKTLIYSTHDMNQTAIADRVVMLKDGNITAALPPRELFLKYKLLSDAGILPPDSLLLTEQLKSRGICLDGVLPGTSPMEMAEKIAAALKGGRK